MKEKEAKRKHFLNKSGPDFSLNLSVVLAIKKQKLKKLISSIQFDSV